MVSIRNDGPIILSEHRSRIFEPFVQYGNDAKGVGIGLAGPHSPNCTADDLVLDDDTTCTDSILTLPVPRLRGGYRRRGAGRSRAWGRTGKAGASDAAHRGGQHRPRGLPETQAAGRIPDTHRRDRRTGAGTAPAAGGRPHPSDIALNGMSGLDLCKKVCTDFETPHILVILLSAPPLDAVEGHGHGCGASLYIESRSTWSTSRPASGTSRQTEHPENAAFREQGHSPRGTPLQPAAQRRGSSSRGSTRSSLANISDPNFSNEQLAEAFFLSNDINRKIKGLLDTTQRLYPHQTAHLPRKC